MGENQIVGAVAAIAMLAVVLVSWARGGTLPDVNRTIAGGVAVGVALIAVALLAEKML